ncbi:MAG TPA: hypothetical protein VGL46_12520 [Pseudonocardiaceae bacterium]
MDNGQRQTLCLTTDGSRPTCATLAARSRTTTPGDFSAIILDGDCVESRWTKQDGVAVPEFGVEHRVDDVNKIGRELFHEVTEVDPYRTLTPMACGPGMYRCGYLDPTTAECTKADLPPKFAQRLRKLNPHQQ